MVENQKSIFRPITSCAQLTPFQALSSGNCTKHLEVILWKHFVVKIFVPKRPFCQSCSNNLGGVREPWIPLRPPLREVLRATMDRELPGLLMADRLTVVWHPTMEYDALIRACSWEIQLQGRQEQGHPLYQTRHHSAARVLQKNTRRGCRILVREPEHHFAGSARKRRAFGNGNWVYCLCVTKTIGLKRGTFVNYKTVPKMTAFKSL